MESCHGNFMIQVSKAEKLLGIILLCTLLASCESGECKLAKQRETEAVLAKEKADMEFYPTALSRKIKIGVNKRLLQEKLEEQKLPPLIQPYDGQKVYERRLLNASIYADSEESAAKSLRIRVCSRFNS